MEWISVNDKLPEPVSNNEWYDSEPYINHDNNLILVVTRERYINKYGKNARSIDIETAMYLYDDNYKTFIWRGIPSYKEILYWCKIPKLPCVDFDNIEGIKGILESPTNKINY